MDCDGLALGPTLRGPGKRMKVFKNQDKKLVSVLYSI
jgi:hypothetical protein